MSCSLCELNREEHEAIMSMVSEKDRLLDAKRAINGGPFSTTLTELRTHVNEHVTYRVELP